MAYPYYFLQWEVVGVYAVLLKLKICIQKSFRHSLLIRVVVANGIKYCIFILKF